MIATGCCKLISTRGATTNSSLDRVEYFTMLEHSIAKQQTTIGKPSKKKYGIIWEFFPNVGPPPLLGAPCKKMGDFLKILVCVSGEFRAIYGHFFGFGNREVPHPPVLGKIHK